EVPIEAVYGNEKSGVSVLREALPFLWKSLRNTVKRLLYCYFLRGFSIASMLLTTGVCAVLFGLSFGIYHWCASTELATAGTVMLAGLPVLSGLQMLIAFVGHDITKQPDSPIHPRLHGGGGA
ncbi:MAG: glycosyltransferase family 2 protein, partial [Gammaproteobacteria bacterium]|nr:glycosyltransferase family 2 protein [Gammaproteobacteria bacterium]